MSKFWGGVAFLIAITVVLLAYGDMQSPESEINFTDLETECRSGGEQANYRLNADDSLSFSGRFAESNTVAELSYDYRKTDERIVLDVRSRAQPLNGTFEDDCLASVVYRAETPPIEEGRYVIEMQHNGETAKKQIVRVR